MTPIILTMQAFGSYGQKTTIDFRKPDQNLFLITGDTGAGKSTIFDGIVFALYGEASSSLNKKDGVELQSQFAGLDTEPYVELVFSVKNGDKDDLYTVRRVPRHMRPARKSGYRNQTVSESVTLTLPDGTDYPQKEANRRIVELVGLTKDQYMQVAMIAQGEFRELLQTDSNRKKEIFRKLFHTDIYQDVVSELDRRSHEKKTEIAQVMTACLQEVSHIRVPEDYERADEMRVLQDRIRHADHLNVADMDRLREELDRLIEKLAADVEKASDSAEKAGGIRDRARDALTEADALARSWMQLEQSKKELEACEQEKTVMTDKTVLQKNIRDAFDIRKSYIRYVDAAGNVRQTSEALEDQEKQLPGLKEAERRAEEGYRAARKADQTAIEAYSREKDRLEKTLQIFSDIETVKKEEASCGERVKTAKRARDAASLALSDFIEQEKKWKADEIRLENADRAYDTWRNHGTTYTELFHEYEAALKEEQQIGDQEQEAKDAADAYKTARSAYLQQKEMYDRENSAFLDAQAGLLAGTLQEGRPCPVCGSTEHPHPCVIDKQQKALTREAIENLAAVTHKRYQECSEASVRSGKASALLQEKRTHLESTMQRIRDRLMSFIPEIFPDTVTAKTVQIPETLRTDSVREILHEIWKVLTNDEKKVKADKNSLDTARKNLQLADQKRESLQRDLDQSKDRLAAENSQLASIHTRLEALQKQTSYPTAGDARKAFSDIEAEKIRADAKAAAAEEKEKQDRSRVENAEALIRQFHADLPRMKKETQERYAEYEDVMRKKDLTEEIWKDTVKNHDEGEADILQEEIVAWQRRKASAEGAAATAEKAINGRPRPDMDQLKASCDAAQQALDAAQKKLEMLKETYRSDTSAGGELSSQLREHGRIVETYTRISSLYERLAGRRTGARMDIETYVQRYYLQQILYAANVRFHEMSGGQFELRMVDEEQAGEGRNRGLDLMVYSYVTGKVREVNTLSGGESFMAALSLALGMADQIQSNSAVDLEMLFIDEGFGSLDEHAREQAIRVLKRMAGKSRLVGIISHVTELKQEIDDQLIVTRDENGSHVHWQIN